MFSPRQRIAAGALLAAVLSGCSLPAAMPGVERPVSSFTPNDFDRSSMYMRHIADTQQNTCEAARRALLSQGYLVQSANQELVVARKYYQPSPETHYTVEMRVVCTPETSPDAPRATAFASAVQDRYVVKKVNNSASLGVGGVGSVSLPFSATDDTLVKVGSETIGDAQFYASFFQLFERYVRLLPEPDRGVPRAVPLQEREAVAPGGR
ncbi:hypothetical protein MASR1M59_26410 [Melaminivora sp.]